jgi:hypothetical protein
MLEQGGETVVLLNWEARKKHSTASFLNLWIVWLVLRLGDEWRRPSRRFFKTFSFPPCGKLRVSDKASASG